MGPREATSLPVTAVDVIAMKLLGYAACRLPLNISVVAVGTFLLNAGLELPWWANLITFVVLLIEVEALTFYLTRVDHDASELAQANEVRIRSKRLIQFGIGAGVLMILGFGVWYFLL